VFKNVTLAVPVINTLEAVALVNVGLNPLAIVWANEAVVAVAAKLALSAFTTLLAVRLNVEPSPLVNVVVALLIDAVTNNEPVFVVTAEPVFTIIGNVVPSPLVNVIVFELTEAVNKLFDANDAVVANDADVEVVANDADVEVVANEALVAVEANEAEVAVEAKLALVANEAETAFNTNDAVVANDAEVAVSALEEVIAKLPVIVFPKPSCNSLPLICVRN